MVRILLRFPEKIVNQPIIAETILKHGIPLNIIAAHVDFHGGQVLVEVPSADIEKVISAFREREVIVTIPKLIEVDKEKCIHCSACYSLCPTGAITISKDFSVVFDKEKCVGSSCGLCVDACPVRAITLTKESNLMVQNSENKKSL
ncbi:MAG: 4Fe-4S binding protein [Candidatus Bathycorpusculaceae bacterium]